ncbi:hypothetical protein K457DRAFT_290660 [Linnemannia elongata AG-77]|uniref:Uncharacterized protein n=1 Tax=Linnemannia elongata AG-77 TaxID=1314771 RepID=A0A197K686_9FUNG|nr:hypothetical protein K457DRAFT_290660 [Linnemannia elongata AG-77]
MLSELMSSSTMHCLVLVSLSSTHSEVLIHWHIEQKLGKIKPRWSPRLFSFSITSSSSLSFTPSPSHTHTHSLLRARACISHQQPQTPPRLLRLLPLQVPLPCRRNPASC